MKIRTKLILNYSFLSIILLLLVSFIVVVSYIKYRQHDFNYRLHNRATSSANMLLNESAIDSSMLRLIDKNIITAMSDLQISIFDQNKKIIYTSSRSSHQFDTTSNNSNKTSILGFINLGYQSISFYHFQNGSNYLVNATAIDNYGNNELKSLLCIIAWVLSFSLLFIVGFGFYNAKWSLKPFKKIIKEVEEINPSLIKKRVTITGNDEITQLAKSFNTLLNRIEKAFETEKSFISNASHELRTPVTSVLGQIEVALNKSRSEEEYKALLQSVYDDTSQMATIINGFLELAESNLENNQVQLKPVRIDELIFSIVDDFKKRKPHYTLSVDFSTNPDTDTQLECYANERLLRLLFNNLIDNACKYSGNNNAKIDIDFSSSEIIISIVDYGIGIPIDELDNIFKPLYRGSNTSSIQGHGIGLAIVKRIADLHNASLNIKSEKNLGTTVTVHFNI
jgi:two-component system, OmpR family, sensor histidine kinase ArlS